MPQRHAHFGEIRHRAPASSASGRPPGHPGCLPVPRAANGGYTLLEVLIALVVLSIGLLGLALLTGMGLQDNTRAYQRSLAVFLAYDIADRMRANPQGMLDKHYVYELKPDEKPPATNSGCGKDSTCDAGERAEVDLYEWANAVRLDPGVAEDDGLPRGSASISTVSENPLLYEVRVRWREPPARGGASRSGRESRCEGAAGGDELSCITLLVRP